MEIELELEVEIAIEKEREREIEVTERSWFSKLSQWFTKFLLFSQMCHGQCGACANDIPDRGYISYVNPRKNARVTIPVGKSSMFGPGSARILPDPWMQFPHGSKAGHLNQDFWYSIRGFVGKWGTSKCAAWSKLIQVDPSWSKLIQVDHDLPQLLP